MFYYICLVKLKEIEIMSSKDYIKANRKGSREAELELTNNGWSAKNKVHKSMKAYSRKTKHKSNY